MRRVSVTTVKRRRYGLCMAFDDKSLQAIGELLQLGEQEGFGITFEPDPEGWTVGYIRGGGGGELLTGFDLGETARGSLRPLMALAEEFTQRRLERERKSDQ